MLTNEEPQMSITLWEAWERSFETLGAKAPMALYVRVFEAWVSPHRRYHGRRHLQDGLNLLQRWSAGQPWPSKVALAWFMHDVVYDPQRHDNEERSAMLSHEGLIAAGLPLGLVESIDDLVLVTCHAAVPCSEDEKLLVDVDLAILGAPPARYFEYTQQVRQEYAHVPDSVFYPARLKVMTSFLGEDGRKVLFHTPQGLAEFDAQARLNIADELERLRARVG